MHKHESKPITILPRYAHSMGFTVARCLLHGEPVVYPDNPYDPELESDNHRAWHEGYALGRPDA